MSSHAPTDRPDMPTGADDTTAPVGDDHHAKARQRRLRLEATVDHVDQVVRASHTDRQQWRTDAMNAVAQLASVFEHHVEETEGEFFADLLQEKPVLAQRVQRLKAVHHEVLVGVERLGGHLFEGVGSATFVSHARADWDELHSALDAHSRQGSDLLYEAYWVDDGGE